MKSISPYFPARLGVGVWLLTAAFGLLKADEATEYAPQNGDVVLQSLGHSPLVDMIEGCTHSPYSHCGLVAKKAANWVVVEAIGPVREIPLQAWIAQGREKGYAVYRLKTPDSTNATEFVRAAYGYLGRPYDIHYDMDDKNIYCSELVFKAYRKATGTDLGKLVKLRELDWQPYEALVREIEKGGLPLDREIITPSNLAKATQLEFIFSTNMPSSSESKVGK